MARRFTLEEARALLPEILRRSAGFVVVRADLAEITRAVQRGGESPLGGLPELKGLEARLHEDLDWFQAQGLEVKGIAPLLLDFPSEFDGEPVLLCWLEGEAALEWYHPADVGFLGRRRIR